MMAYRPELLLQNNNIFGAKAGDHIHIDSTVKKGLGLGVGNSAPHAAAYYAHFFCPLRNFCRNAQRTDKIQNSISLIQIPQQLGRKANLLKDDSHRSLFPVIVGDSQRNPLPHLIHPKNDKLSS